MAQFDWKKRYAMEKTYGEKIDKLFGKVPNTTGVYVFLRKDENGFKFAYIGQAVDIRKRVLSHLIEHKQHIDNSLTKRGLYSPKNTKGWHLIWYVIGEASLDDFEKATIHKYNNDGFQLYNTTAGGQGEGKILLTENSGGKGYRQGVEYGEEKARKIVKEFFDKYLTFSIKEPVYNKEGKIFVVKQNKFNEFSDWLEGKK